MLSNATNGVMRTRILPVDGKELGRFTTDGGVRSLDIWYPPECASDGFQTLSNAAQLLRTSNIPVAFPTETVYGLGADATRSEAVKGIYEAKGRPSDNPLIIHISDLSMLREIFLVGQANGHSSSDPIPAIYKPLVDRFWPGPLTILLPNPHGSRLAPEVTAGLETFGVRMPDSPLALSLIKLAGVPIAAPSANASTKPSTTTAEHVLHDLNGRIEVILDGGSCQVGVESTIVDGLCSPPVILRPGGISINSIRECKGWGAVQKAYKDDTETGSGIPRAPGMKYKHYSPRAKVILAEGSADIVPKDLMDLRLELGNDDQASLHRHQSPPNGQANGKSLRSSTIGVVRTRYWAQWGGWNESCWTHVMTLPSHSQAPLTATSSNISPEPSDLHFVEGELYEKSDPPLLLAKIIETSLGNDTRSIAHGLFSALRELDARGVNLIYVEGIEDDIDASLGQSGEGDIAAAVMNRLRKAATIIRS